MVPAYLQSVQVSLKHNPLELLSVMGQALIRTRIKKRIKRVLHIEIILAVINLYIQ
jgi:hypothetical protein